MKYTYEIVSLPLVSYMSLIECHLLPGLPNNNRKKLHMDLYRELHIDTETHSEIKFIP